LRKWAIWSRPEKEEKVTFYFSTGALARVPLVGQRGVCTCATVRNEQCCLERPAEARGGGILAPTKGGLIGRTTPHCGERSLHRARPKTARIGGCRSVLGRNSSLWSMINTPKLNCNHFANSLPQQGFGSTGPDKLDVPLAMPPGTPQWCGR